MAAGAIISGGISGVASATSGGSFSSSFATGFVNGAAIGAGIAAAPVIFIGGVSLAGTGAALGFASAASG